MNRLRQTFNNHRQERHQRSQDALIDYVHNPDALRPLDDLKTDDMEILGNKSENLFRDRYRKHADRIIKKADHLDMNSHTPGLREQYTSYRKNRIDAKIDRVERKLKDSSGSFFARQIDRQRRQKLEELKYKQKINKKHSTKLEEKRKEKPEELRKKIDKQVKDKVDAMYRKAQRKELKRNDIGKHNFVKRAEFIAKITPEKRKEIMREALLLVRSQNIKKGRLDTDYQVDFSLNNTRKVTDEYARTIK